MCEKCEKINASEVPMDFGDLESLIEWALNEDQSSDEEQSVEEKVEQASTTIGAYIMVQAENAAREKLGLAHDLEQIELDWDPKIQPHADELITHMMEDLAIATGQLVIHMREILTRVYLEGTVQGPDEISISFERIEDEE